MVPRENPTEADGQIRDGGQRVVIGAIRVGGIGGFVSRYRKNTEEHRI